MTHIKTLFLGASAAALLAACSGADAEYEAATVERDATAYVSTSTANGEQPTEPVADTQLSDVSEEMVKEEVADIEYSSILTIAAGSEDFETLTDLVVEAELVDTLNEGGPFTVFAPNDDAFAKVDESTVADLKTPENQYQLQSILTYHVVPGTVIAADLVTAIGDNDGRFEIETVQGSPLYASLEDGAVTLTDESGSSFKVITSDITADNGVIHVIDGVMMPS